MIRAAPWSEVVSIPTCHPVKDTTGYRIFSKHMAIKAMDCCSPVDNSISNSRFDGRSLSSAAFSSRSSVVSP